MARLDGSNSLDGINDNTYNMLFRDYENITDFENSFKDFMIFMEIDEFTKLHNPKLDKTSKMKYMESGIDITHINYDEENNTYAYEDEKNIYPFLKLSDLVNDRGSKEDLESEKRYGKCHTSAIFLAPFFENSKVLTGYITLDDMKVLHSVVELPKEGKLYIVDWTKNIVMFKEDYIKLFKFEEHASYKGDVIKDDLPLLDGLKIGSKAYVCFRDEIMNDLNKNIKVFKK